MRVALELRRRPVIGRLVHRLLQFYGLVIPNEVEIGSDLHLEYHGTGTVIHPAVTIGDRVAIYHQVTIGQADGWLPWLYPGMEPAPGVRYSAMERVVVGDDVILFPGAKILGGPGTTTIGDGTIVGANAVLTGSTGEWEIWAGVPARKIGARDRSAPHRYSTLAATDVEPAR